MPARIIFSLLIVGMAAVGALLFLTMRDPGTPPSRMTAADGPVEFTGRAVCSECHSDETAAWTGSHHDRAMEPAAEETIVGDFGDASFTYFGVTSTFFRRDGGFFARTDGPDGGLREYPIAYTFGFDPLQQYLIEFPDGRYQALNVCWDTRPAGEGGGRWFHLYPDEEIDHDDILHWTGPYQNWNHMCAECHSTNLRKNYRAGEERYETTWSEIDVSCEACHGPGSRHVAWGREWDGAGGTGADRDPGFTFRFPGDPGGWRFQGDDPTATRVPPRAGTAEVETCGRCHARRARIWDEYRHGTPLADTFRIALLEEGLYFADGQIRDEVYVYGSFLQSRMYRAGVTCTDCHEPHSARLRAGGNAACLTCHRARTFDRVEHHLHAAGGPGSFCVDCHMPARDYMVVDPRRDHSFRVPRPDLSSSIGTPNACNGCHDAETPEWAAAILRERFGAERADRFHYGTALHAGREWRPQAERLLVRVAEDPDSAPIVRATALSLLPPFLGPASAGVVERGLGDADPLVRGAAVEVLGTVDPGTRWQLAHGLLADPVRTVRLAAAAALAGTPASLPADIDRPLLTAALGEYFESQRFNLDRPEAHLNLGLIHARTGNTDMAEAAFRKALTMRPDFVPARVNLADLYRVLDRDDEGERILRAGLDHTANVPELHHALGLLLVRQGRIGEALDRLRTAYERRAEPRFGFVYAIALKDSGEAGRALGFLQRAHDRFPGSRDILIGLATIARDRGDLESALAWAGKWRDLQPENRDALALIADLERRIQSGP